jgi:hypothetical protein
MEREMAAKDNNKPARIAAEEEAGASIIMGDQYRRISSKAFVT